MEEAPWQPCPCSIPGPDVREGMEFAAQKKLGVWGLVPGEPWLWASRSSCPLPCKVLAAAGTMVLFPPRALLLCTAVLLFLSSHIYCTGELLRQVQLARLFQDDKDFVDMPLKSNPGECPPLQHSPLPSARVALLS